MKAGPGGLAGFGLRLWQRTSALDPVTELFATGAPATLALWGLMAALALAALLLGRGGAAPEEPERAFHCPSTGYMTLMTAAGMCFLLAAALGLPELMEQLRAWQADPVHHIMPGTTAPTCIFWGRWGPWSPGGTTTGRSLGCKPACRPLSLPARPSPG